MSSALHVRQKRKLLYIPIANCRIEMPTNSLTLFALLSLMWLGKYEVWCQTNGCTDTSALNFSSNAETDDGSCVYQENLPDGWIFTPTPSSGTFLGNITLDGGNPANEPFVLGAFTAEGLCVGLTFPIASDGLDYVALAIYGDDLTTTDVDGMQANDSFTLALHLIESDTTLQNLAEENLFDDWVNSNGAPMPAYNDVSTSYDFLTGANCTETEACNYNPLSSIGGECEYPEEGLNCQGDCLEDEDGDGVCNEDEVLGCTLPSACNYDTNATDNDGSCLSLDEIGICGGGCEADVDDDGICDDEDPCVGILDTCGICNGPGAVYECGCEPLDPWACDCDGNVYDVCGECGGTGTLGCLDEDACNYNGEACGSDGSCIYPMSGMDCNGDVLEVGGCMDNLAPNFNPQANVDDGSCFTGGCILPYACNFDGEADYYLPGTCDFVSCLGCMDESACNFDAFATLESFAMCTYPEAFYLGCDGMCLNDSDGDGICDEIEIPGCTNQAAPNFNPYATEDNGTCSPTLVGGCILPFACNFDPTANFYLPGSCDFECLYGN